MKSRIALALLTTLLLASTAGAESHSGTLAFSNAEIVGNLSFTALAPGETSSAFLPFSGYSQAVSPDYTYLYLVENNSVEAGNPDPPFCDDHCFIDLDLLTLLDPTNPTLIHSFGADDSNGGELPSAIDPNTAPNDIDYQFDLEPSPPGPPPGGNYGIVPGGESAFLFFYSSSPPSYDGGALITNNLQNFASIGSGVTTPVPEPTSALLLLAGLVGFAARRRCS